MNCVERLRSLSPRVEKSSIILPEKQVSRLTKKEPDPPLLRQSLKKLGHILMMLFLHWISGKIKNRY